MKPLNVQTNRTGETPPCPLSIAREQINHIDEEIISLLEKRFNIVMEIGEYKKENNLPVLDEEREKKVVKTCIGYLKNKNYSKAVEDIYTQIMGSSKELERSH
jgi:monofunctional chorismate mutase